ncbi:MAG: helix-turn-helix domain-containing protein [Silicimonas sp.]|jgi:transcriptional regulator with XRE-family HTH domain|nr:helix-turn-helix domain-containing protein [Silicimonas sp.]
MSAQSPPESLGHDLRVLRKQRGLTLVQVAGAVNRSVGWLSQVERNISEPSEGELLALAETLDFSIDGFYGPEPSAPDDASVIVRSHARRRFGTRVPGLVEELLSPDLTDAFEVVHSTFLPGAERSDPVTRPTQEVGYVISGQLEITIAGRAHLVDPGDSFRIRGEPFRWANRGPEPCVVIWVIAPPVY